MPAGRPPKPTTLRVLEGKRGHRPLRREPQAQGAPMCPANLRGEAKLEWKRVVPDLERMGILGSVDRMALASYCQSWARWLEVEEALDAEPLDRRLHMMASRLKGDMLRLAVEFGLTPAARARMGTAQKKSAEDPLDALLS